MRIHTDCARQAMSRQLMKWTTLVLPSMLLELVNVISTSLYQSEMLFLVALLPLV